MHIHAYAEIPAHARHVHDFEVPARRMRRTPYKRPSWFLRRCRRVPAIRKIRTRKPYTSPRPARIQALGCGFEAISMQNRNGFRRFHKDAIQP